MSKRSKREKRQRNQGRALARPVARAFTAVRTGLPFRSALSDVTNFHRWMMSWVYIATERNATAVSQQPLNLFRRDRHTPRDTKPLTKEAKTYLRKAEPSRFTEDTVQVQEHPFLNVMNRPNPILDGASLLWLTDAHLELGGAAFWHLTRKNGVLAEIWPLPAQFVWPVLGPTRVFDSYQMRIGGKVIDFPPEDIAHFRRPSPLDTLGAFGPLRGVIETCETNIRMLEYDRAMFENFGVPDVLISAKGDTTPEQLRKLQADFDQEFGSWRNAGKTMAVPAEVEVHRLSETNRELQFSESRKAVRDEILAGFGVPLPIVIPTDATFSNLRDAVRFWRMMTISTRLKLISEVINCSIMPDFAPQGAADGVETEAVLPWFVAFEDPTPEDENEKVVRDTARLASATVTINEVRAENGDEPAPWGAEPWMTAGLVQPSGAVAQLEREEQAAERDFLRTSAEAVATVEAGTTPVPPSFAELTAVLTQMASTRDVEGANLVRAEIAVRLGGSLNELDDIRPAASAASVNPDDEPEPKNDAIPGEGAEGEEKPEAKEEEGGGGEAKKPKTEAQNPQKPKSAGGGAGDGEAEGAAAFIDRLVKRFGRDRGIGHVIAASDWWESYRKINRDELEPERQDKTLLGEIRALFARMKAAVEEKIEPLIETVNAMRQEGKKLPLKQAMGMLFDPAKWVEEFVKVTSACLRPVVMLGSQLAAADVARLGKTPTILTPEGIETATQRFARKAGAAVIGDFQERFAVKLAPILQPADDEPIPTSQELATLVEEIFVVKDRSHAVMIARTEMNNALNAGGAETFLISGIKQHEWLASPDACEFCLALNGKTVDVGEPFAKVGDVVKGVDGGSFRVTFREITHPTLHPNCVCTVIPIVT